MTGMSLDLFGPGFAALLEADCETLSLVFFIPLNLATQVPTFNESCAASRQNGVRISTLI